MKVSPVGHRVLIKLEEVEIKTKTGIILATDKEKNRQQTGAQFAKVVAVGPTAWAEYDEPWAKVGDRVITVRYPGAQFEYDDEEMRLYRIINDDEILSVVE